MDGSTKFCVILDPQTRQRLEDITRNGNAPAKKIQHARVLLMGDQQHPLGRYTDEQIGRILTLHVNTVARIRKQFVLHGEGPALDRKLRLTPPVAPKLDGAKEAHLIAICCSKPPQGRAEWTLNLLAKELMGRKIVTSICIETVRKALKKTRCSPG
jgi:hypothetical protein